MDREIKFRGKRLDNNEWVYGFYQYFSECGDNGAPSPYFKETCTLLHYIVDSENKVYMVDPKTVGQYTGFKDKKQNEIYEKDIVGGIDWVGNIAGSIEFSIELGLWLLKYKSGGDEILCKRLKEIEVVGNIPDNPELLNNKRGN